MHIEHLAIWVKDLELLKDFYQKYFSMECGDKYQNAAKCYESYFLRFPENDSTRIELMHRPAIVDNMQTRGLVFGYAHVAISVGSKDAVDRLTEEIRAAGYNIVGEPRTTGDGYYESVIEDPEGNWIEITI